MLFQISTIETGAITVLESGLEQNNQLIADNNAKMYEAQLHAQGLETQVRNAHHWKYYLLNYTCD